MTDQYLVIDIENNNSKQYGRKAGNFLLDEIVAIGYKPYDTPFPYSDYKQDLSLDYQHLIAYKTLVLHNATHDLLFFWDNPDLQEFFRQGGKIWCTQLAEYMLTGHQTKMVSLRDLATAKYGCQVRQKKMEAYWDQGIQTSDIPPELVIEDVTQDVLDTEQIYLQQIKTAKELGMTKVIELRMDGLLACIECEYNGMKVDLDILKENQQKLETELRQKQQELMQMIQEHWKP